MSGHSEYTSWIDREAKYLLCKDGKTTKNITGTFFTSSKPPMHNSDEFMINLSNEISLELGKPNSNIDWEDLRKRFESYSKNNKKKEIRIR